MMSGLRTRSRDSGLRTRELEIGTPDSGIGTRQLGVLLGRYLQLGILLSGYRDIGTVYMCSILSIIVVFRRWL